MESCSVACVLFGFTPLAAAFSSSSRILLRSSHMACLRASSDADLRWSCFFRASTSSI